MTSLLLHVDDDPNGLVMVKRAVQMANSGVQVVSANHSAEAIECLSGTGVYADRQRYPLPSLVLLDLKMPRQNSFEVLSWIRSQKKLQRLPVVILTSSKHQEDMDRAYHGGANSYLMKPLGFEELVEFFKDLLHYWLNLNRATSN